MHIRHGGCNAQAGACTLWRGLLNKSPKNMKPAACALFYLLLQGKAESPWSGESAPNTFCKDTNVPTAYRATFGTALLPNTVGRPGIQGFYHIPPHDLASL